MLGSRPAYLQSSHKLTVQETSVLSIGCDRAGIQSWFQYVTGGYSVLRLISLQVSTYSLVLGHHLYPSDVRIRRSQPDSPTVGDSLLMHAFWMNVLSILLSHVMFPVFPKKHKA
jgi:hypothetical protein